MARHTLPPIIGESVHGQSRSALLKLHQESLEKTINSMTTEIDGTLEEKLSRQSFQRMQNRKKKKNYPWVQRDSQAQREKIGLPGNKFIHHPCAVLYQVDLPFPGYDREAPTFHWKYDSVIDSLISNNPPSLRRSKVNSSKDSTEEVSQSSTPMIGHRMLSRAQRKDIKKVHVPKGVVMQYEGELVEFLDRLTISDASNREEESVSTEDSNWVFVQPGDDQDSEPEDLAPVVESVENAESLESTDKEEVTEDDQRQVYLQWDIQDQFLRFVAHALCAFYGLVSFSKTAVDGKRLVYICHPTHLDSIGQLATTSSEAVESLPESAAPVRPKPVKRQSTLEHVQELPLHELNQLWNKVAPVKLTSCPRPEMTFFEYLYPSTRPMF
ncbi:hypothetical protein BGZ76_008524 [Entomortierella beljakovae]|nr:hypothetical protein BGZ76_008524 [Entomortierella beljakovae]